MFYFFSNRVCGANNHSDTIHRIDYNTDIVSRLPPRSRHACHYTRGQPTSVRPEFYSYTNPSTASLFDASLVFVTPTMTKPQTSIPISGTHAARVRGITCRGDVVPSYGAKMCVILPHRASWTGKWRSTE